jgi:DUF218 domain
MQLLDRIGHWMQGVDYAIPAEMVIVLDGADFDLRLAAALDLLNRSFVSRALFSLGASSHEHAKKVEIAAKARPDKIHILRHHAASLWEDAAEVRNYLRQSWCASVVVVTTWYQARRTRLVFARTLRAEVIAVNICPVHAPHAAGARKSNDETRAILLEPFRLFGAWLHRGSPRAARPREDSANKHKAA